LLLKKLKFTKFKCPEARSFMCLLQLPLLLHFFRKPETETSVSNSMNYLQLQPLSEEAVFQHNQHNVINQNFPMAILPKTPDRCVISLPCARYVNSEWYSCDKWLCHSAGYKHAVFLLSVQRPQGLFGSASCCTPPKGVVGFRHFRPTIKRSRLAPVHALNACMGDRGMAPLIPNLSVRWRWVMNFSPQQLCPRERTPVPLEQETGKAPEPIWIPFRTEVCSSVP
jgi:hypothetical protein